MEQKEKWDEEKKKLSDRIKELEMKEERQERKLRRSNIIIKGIKWQGLI